MHVLLVGATGEVGSKLLARLLADDRILYVTIWSRRAIDLNNPKLTTRIVDFENLPPESDDDIDAVVCCVGTTIKKAGSRKAFREVDYDICLNVATWAESQGINQFHVISANGANPDSLFFYNRVKGEMEEALFQLPIPYMYVYRPNLIDSDRSEKRPLERFAILLFRALNPLLIGPFRSLASIKSERIAQGIHTRLFDAQVGYHIIASKNI